MLRTALILMLRPVLWLVLGLSIAGRAHLPRKGPAIVAANHNSHLDILVLAAAFKREALPLVTPVAAADYFLATPLLRFIAQKIIGIVPLDRTIRAGSDPLQGARAALEAGRILIVFPEGTRGAPEELGALKSGLTKLCRDGNIPLIPAYIQGAGRILPKGTRVPVPFTCTVLIGRPLQTSTDRAETMAALSAALDTLKAAAPPLHWD
ncbi:MAG: lysophospholipid acyltransferase family protein [Pseudomonadota bacterium]